MPFPNAMKNVIAHSIRTVTLVSLSAVSLSAVLGLSGWSASPAWANTSAADELLADSLLDNARDRTPQSCNTAETLAATPAVMLLTPDGMGQTMSTQPTFFWFSPETSPENSPENSAEPPTLFRLYEYDAESGAYTLLTESQMTASQITASQITESQDDLIQNASASASDREAGIMALTLPSEMVTLNIGQRYLWQVEVTCSGAENLVAEAEFEVVEPGEKMMDSLAAATTAAEKTNILASENLWYDALSMMFSASSSEDMTAVRQMIFEAVATSATEQAQLESSPVVRQDLLIIPVR